VKYHRLFLPVWMLGILSLTSCSLFTNSSDVDSSAKKKTVEEVVAPANLNVDWSVDVDQRHLMSPFGYSQPALVGKEIVIGGRDARVHVYNLQGDELRRIAIEAPCESGALALNPALVVLADVKGTLYGINPQAGSIVWRYSLSSVLLGHPVRVGDGFMVQTADNRIYRFSPKGKKRWSYAGLPGGLTMHQGSAPRVFGGIAYAVFSDGDIVALRTDSGDLVWRRQLLLDMNAVTLNEMKVPVADPVLVGKIMIVSFYQGNVIALSMKDGQQLWQRKLSLKTTPIMQADHLLAATSDGAVVALDVASGATLWRQKLTNSELVGPSLSQGKVFVGDAGGHVYALAPDGHKTGVLSLPGRIDRAPIVILKGGVLIRNSLGGLYRIQ